MTAFKRIFALLIVFTVLASCNNSNDARMETNCTTKFTSWISGKYKLTTNHGNYYENWEKLDSVNYKGIGYFMNVENDDTLFRQSMKWSENENGVYMIFNVKNQNDNKDVEFKLTKHERNIYTFENAFRDYPSIITYKILNDTSVNVVMYGFKDKEEKKEDFIITKQR